MGVGNELNVRTRCHNEFHLSYYQSTFAIQPVNRTQMMDPFPEEWELLSLFEIEPTIADSDRPWFYNCLTFQTERADDFVRCRIEPSDEILEINWWHKGKEKLTLELHWVAGLRVVTGGGIDYLVATFRDPYLYDLEFHLKPGIKLRWATSTSFPRQ